MKNAFFLLFVLIGWSACQNDNSDGVQEIRTSQGPNSQMIRNPATADLPLDTNKLARIYYFEDTYDFGEVEEGTIVKHEFKFKNTGNVPLNILNAQASCGCTIPEWPKEPVPPGGTGVILAKFNTEMKLLDQHKTISVTANTYPNVTQVVLKGKVNPKKG